MADGSGQSRRRSSGSRSRSGARKSTAKRSTSRKRSSSPKAKASRGKRASSSARSGTRTKPKTRRAPASRADKSVQQFRETLERSVMAPMNLVMISRDRIQEVFDEAVSRGRMTRDDANDLASGLLERGRKQTNDVLKDLDRLTSRARRQADQAAGRARRRAVGVADPALAQADRMRRQYGVGSSFPITAYDELTAAQVQARISDLTPAELRKVRDYEKRNAGRKTILKALEKKLG